MSRSLPPPLNKVVMCQQTKFVCNNVTTINPNYSGIYPKCIRCRNLPEHTTVKSDGFNSGVANRLLVESLLDSTEEESEESYEQECQMCFGHGACAYCKCGYCWHNLECPYHPTNPYPHATIYYQQTQYVNW